MKPCTSAFAAIFAISVSGCIFDSKLPSVDPPPTPSGPLAMTSGPEALLLPIPADWVRRDVGLDEQASIYFSSPLESPEDRYADDLVVFTSPGDGGSADSAMARRLALYRAEGASIAEARTGERAGYPSFEFRAVQWRNGMEIDQWYVGILRGGECYVMLFSTDRAAAAEWMPKFRAIADSARF